MNLKEIVEALKKSDFKCVAGDLEDFTAFIELERKANDTRSMCCLGREHPCMLNVNDGFCAAEACQYKVREYINTAADEMPEFEGTRKALDNLRI